ncbi:hypothetical protein VHEMI07260 [[Torrubiella] hemipterigena]|uniref:tRNA-splicing endonuclease subunit Sen54 N-terminal domain-containing protein n=1 Tax=[Torrubiella] hemipterigena TaxID=1531966 RepID=A0A0A1TLB9_9HYPO|nr:hypothetical protein VHEMI07260 [[Torrubiella] hemipterigena]
MPFDDDDDPSLLAKPTTGNGDSEANNAAEDALEDEVPDYKLFLSMFEKRNVSSKTIRKGEKDFESHGTQAQDNTLESSRRALEEVLSYTRVHRDQSWVRGWYFPDFWANVPPDQRPADQDGLFLEQRVVVVEHERGSWMKDLGRAVPGSKTVPGAGRLWLLPEEALHLVERGTMDLWWPSRSLEELLPQTGEPSIEDMGPDNYDIGVPLTLEAAYSLLIGEDNEPGKTTLPKYQVFTNLKRAGFHILRNTENLPISGEVEGPKTTLWQWLFSFFSIDAAAQQTPKPYGPLIAPGLYRAYRPVYKQLAILPRHKPTLTPSVNHDAEDPFKVHYLLWKSGGEPFSKRSPREPDFRIAVTDTTDTGLPTLEEVEGLLQSTPYCPPPDAMRGNPGRMYQRLKHGHRNVLVAIVDRGLVNYMRFAEGAFGEELVFERYDAKRGGRGGGKRSGGRGRGGRGRGRGGRR